MYSYNYEKSLNFEIVVNLLLFLKVAEPPNILYVYFIRTSDYFLMYESRNLFIWK